MHVRTLAVDGLAYVTVRSYIAGVRYAQIKKGWPDPQWGNMPRLGQVLRSIRRVRAEKGCREKVRLPISPEPMLQLKKNWQRRNGFDATMLWAATCLCFFGCLRAGEVTAPERGKFDPKAHLTFDDMPVDRAEDPTRLSVRLKASKTDQFREGTVIHLGRTGQALCPVAAMLAYLVRRKEGEGPLFRFEDGRLLTRPWLVREVKEALEEGGVGSTGISGHSFRIGAATTAAERGVEDSTIKELERWKSNVFQRYVRRDRKKLAELSEKLAKVTP